MSSELKSKSIAEIFSDVFFIIKKNWFKLILFYFIPFILLNTFGGIASIGPKTFQKKNSIDKPFTFYFSTKQKIDIESQKNSAEISKKINGWSYIPNLPQKTVLKIKISHDKKWTEYRINSKKFKQAWLIKNQVVYQAPASFNLRLPTLPSDAVRFGTQIGSVIINLIFILFILVVALFTYFNKPPISISEIFRFMRSNILNFLATGMFVAIISIVILLMTVVNIFFIPLSFWVLAKILMALPITITEGIGLANALKRSFALSRDNILKIILPLFITTLIGLMLFIVANLITASLLNIDTVELAMSSAKIVGKTVLIWPEALLLISTVFLILFSPLIPILVIYFYNLYIDLRIKSEGLEGNLKEDFFKVKEVEES